MQRCVILPVDKPVSFTTQNRTRRSRMKTTSAMLVASALSLASMFAFADDKTQWITTPAEQAKMEEEVAAKNAAAAKMTPEQRAAAQNARDAETRKYEHAIEDRISGLAPSRNMATQAKLKEEADAEEAAAKKMTPEQKAAAQNARDAETRKYEHAIEDRISGLGPSRNMGINKSAEASKAGPTPPQGTINTPEAGKLLLNQKGE
jgi:hypothetical protein